jgi:hypothetical protein
LSDATGPSFRKNERRGPTQKFQENSQNTKLAGDCQVSAMSGYKITTEGIRWPFSSFYRRPIELDGWQWKTLNPGGRKKE